MGRAMGPSRREERWKREEGGDGQRQLSAPALTCLLASCPVYRLGKRRRRTEGACARREGPRLVAATRSGERPRETS